jgi:hypothetical protein
MMMGCIAMTAAAALTGCALEPGPDAAGEASQAERVVPHGAASPCPDGTVCLYQDPGGGGMRVVLSAGTRISDFRMIRCPGCISETIGSDGTFDKQMSSWENRSVFAYCFYEKPSFEGPSHVVAIDKLHDAQPAENNVASSIEPCRSPGL